MGIGGDGDLEREEGRAGGGARVRSCGDSWSGSRRARAANGRGGRHAVSGERHVETEGGGTGYGLVLSHGQPREGAELVMRRCDFLDAGTVG